MLNWLITTNYQVERVKYMHDHGYLLCGVMPDKIAFGRSQRENELYFSSLESVKRYRDPVTRKHIPYAENKDIEATPTYASNNALSGIGMYHCTFDYFLV